MPSSKLKIQVVVKLSPILEELKDFRAPKKLLQSFSGLYFDQNSAKRRSRNFLGTVFRPLVLAIRCQAGFVPKDKLASKRRKRDKKGSFLKQHRIHCLVL